MPAAYQCHRLSTATISEKLKATAHFAPMECTHWDSMGLESVVLLQKAPPGSIPNYTFAEIYLRVGSLKAAIHSLEKSFEGAE
jgi:hypothetical protein